MKRDIRSREWEEFYSTGRHNLADDFYGPAIARSTLIERAVGFFRSTAYLLMYEEFCEFLRDGGKLKLICSPRMHKEDIATLNDSLEGSSEPLGRSDDLLAELDELRESQSGQLHLKIFGGMLKFGLVELKIALTAGGGGIFHEKIGILHDAQGQVLSFTGSANETLCGWGLQGNVESFDVFRSWRIEDRSRIQNHTQAFIEAWEGRRPGVKTLDLEAAVRNKLLEEAPEDEAEMFRAVNAYRVLKRDILNKQRRPLPLSHSETDEWPSGRSAEAYQIKALDAWQRNNCYGIFKHATGSGKTFTGLHGVREHVRGGKVALLVVPSKLLFRSWRDELRQEIPNSTLTLAGDGNNGWRKPYALEAFTSRVGPEDRRIILATMQTASSPEFYRRLKNPAQILLVADEVHQLGSAEFSKLMETAFGKRLGLSATPERFGDAEGTGALLDYFGGIVGGEFTLNDAMDAGRLVPYRYHPIFVSLNEEEREVWHELTLEIRRLAAQSHRDSGGNISPSNRLKNLLIRRARVAKKAHSKVEMARRTLREHYEPGQYWLIYCEDQEQMDDVLQSLRDEGFDPLIYHSAMLGDPQRTLDYFVNNGGIMVSIRCLDEGVDIPRVSHAVILASSQNPRQFIQRRGRVLRVAPHKTRASIWDALVLPVEDGSDEDKAQDSLTRAELVRALEFADSAMNQEEASRLRMTALDLGIDPSNIYDAQEDDG